MSKEFNKVQDFKDINLVIEEFLAQNSERLEIINGTILVSNEHKETLQQNLNNNLIMVKSILFDIYTNQHNLKNFENTINTICQSQMLDEIVNYINPANQLGYQVQKICLWIISLILCTSANHIMELVLGKGVLNNIFAHLDSEDMYVREFAIQCVANVMGDNASYKEQLYKNGIIRQITDIVVKRSQSQQLLENLSFLISNIMSTDYQIPYDDLEPLIPLLNKLLQQDLISKENECLAYDVIQSLENLLTSRKKSIKQRFIDNNQNIIIRMIEILELTRKKAFPVQITESILQFFSELTSINSKYVNKIVQIGIVQVLYQYTSFPQKQVRYITMSIIDNICQCKHYVIDAVIENSQLLRQIHLCADEKETDMNVRFQAIQAWANLIINSDEEQILELLQYQELKIIVKGLLYHEYDVLICCLKSIQALLDHGDYVKEEKNLFKNPMILQLDNSFENGKSLFQQMEKIAREDSRKEIVKIAEEITDEFYEISVNSEENEEEDDFRSPGYEEYTEVNGVPLKEVLQQEQQLKNQQQQQQQQQNQQKPNFYKNFIEKQQQNSNQQ